MSTLKRRLHRKNSSGGYDTIHLETESSLVLRPSGRTVEEDLAAYLPEVQSSDTVPESLKSGKMIIAKDRVYIGDYNNLPMEVVTMAHELNIGTINGLTAEQILDKMVEKKIGIAAGSSGNGGTVSDAIASGLLEGKLISGETVRFDGMYWVVAHTDYINKVAYLASTILVTNTQFGSNTTYKGSTLASVAANFEATMSDAAKAVMKDVTVNNVTAKVFAPTYDQVNGGWSYFATQANRVCNLNGVASNWWTSSPGSSSGVYCVDTSGALSNNGPSNTYGFRPCVALAL